MDLPQIALSPREPTVALANFFGVCFLRWWPAVLVFPLQSPCVCRARAGGEESSSRFVRLSEGVEGGRQAPHCLFRSFYSPFSIVLGYLKPVLGSPQSSELLVGVSPAGSKHKPGVLLDRVCYL